MSAKFTGDDQRTAVLDATDLVALVGEHVRLTARGKEFVGLCPFHEDHKPSMYVSPAKQIYKCFSCGAGGNAYNFVMNYHKLAFGEAIKHLAQRAGIELRRFEGARDLQPGEKTDRQKIAEANAQAVAFFQALLKHEQHGKVARVYLAGRGVNAQMIEAFGLGVSPDMWDGLVRMVNDKKWDVKSFELAGLISQREHSEGQSHYDRLRNRLIFPILDDMNRPIAFGGRRLNEDDDPKYLNSPETVLFNKSATLYGLHLAKKPIIDARVAVIVEGYTDVIACHQAGFDNVIAALGTALTSQHLSRLQRYAEKVVLIFDADQAGQKAADRAVELFLTSEIDVAVAVLPDGLDPDELLGQSGGHDMWGELVAEAPDALSYQFARMRERFEVAGSIAGRQHLVEGYLRQLAQLGLARQNQLRRAMIFQQLSDLVGTSADELAGMLKRMGPTNRGGGGVSGRGGEKNEEKIDLEVASQQVAPKIKAIREAELQVIGCLLLRPQLFHEKLDHGRALDETLEAELFINKDTRQLLAAMQEQISDGQRLTLQGLLAELASQNAQALCDLATACEGVAEQLTEGRNDRLMTVLTAALDAMRAYEREKGYGQLKQQGASSDDQADRLRRVVEFQRANPSPTRIARV